MQILDFLLTLFASDVVRNKLHRTGAIQCENSDDFLNRIGTKLPTRIDHAARFHLEHTDRFAAFDQFKGLEIIQGHISHTEAGVSFIDPHFRLIDHRQGLEAKEVHLQHAQLGEGLHGKLGDDFLVISAC